MIGPEQQSAVRDLAAWYIAQTVTEEQLRSVADEIAWLKTAVPLRKNDVDILTRHYRKQQQTLKEAASA